MRHTNSGEWYEATGYTWIVNDDETAKLNAIVGSAIKALVESGADDAYVGSFAASHRAKVARILGQSETVDEPPDLLAMVTKAVQAALAGLPGSQAGLSLPLVGHRKKVAKRVYVTVAGRSTSLTLREESVARLTEILGDKRKAKAVIQDLASSAPQDTPNRSRWVEDRIFAYMDTLDMRAGKQQTQTH